MLFSKKVTFSKLTGVLGLVVATMGVLGAGGASARASVPGPRPAWFVQGVAQPSSFSSADDARCEAQDGLSGSCDHYIVVPVNSGAYQSEGALTLRDELPAGVTTIGEPRGQDEIMKWRCSTSVPIAREVVECDAEFSGVGVPALTPAAEVDIPVVLAPSSAAVLENSIEVAGGGAATTTVTQRTEVAPDDTSPAFGPVDFEASLLAAAGEPDIEAAAHPAGFVASFGFPTAFLSLKGGREATNPVEPVRQIVMDLPAGVIGDARSAAACPLIDVANLKEEQTQCPAASRIGKVSLVSPEGANTELVLFNVTPEHGYAAEFAVYLPLLERAELLYAKLTGAGANARARVVSAPQSQFGEEVGVAITFFGAPGALNGGGGNIEPFFTNPSDCSASGFTSTIYADSWQNPGRVEADGEPDLSDPNWKRASSTMPPVTGCESLQFHPSLTFAPEGGHHNADEPSGYESVLKIPQNESVSGLATPPLKTTTVTLPAGVAISPSAANGLVGCEFGSSGIGLSSEVEASQPGHCPEASKVGEVEAKTPVLEEPLKGSVFVAQPACSPCSEAQAEDGEVFGLYLELGNEVSGVYVKLKGKVEVGGNGQHSREIGLAPGQVRTTFAETPQDPVSELKLKFNGGQRAPLANPQTCGQEKTTAELEPWSYLPEGAGTPNVTSTSSFAITGCEGRFAPSFSAGATNPQAGHYSPVTLTFSRQDREQDLSGVTVKMPPGLLGKIAGIPRCGEAQANAGTCSAASQVGTATGGAGSGSQPLYQSGPVYLTGPYRGAPFGLSIVVPAVAGPFNLGNIVVRAAISVNPTTAAISVVSDPLPQSVDGVPLRLKTVSVTVGSAGNFTFNPTNCGEEAVGATLTGAGGTSVPVSSRFQVANCANLPFKPALSATTAGSASKANGASLNVKVSYPAGPIGSYANIKSVKVDLPKQLPSRLTTLQKACLASVFEANPANCPAASDVGTATATTPVLNVPLEGPAYIVSHGGEAFPDLEIVLQGEGIKLILDGNTQIKKGITSSTFKTIPDAPVSGFDLKLPTGKYSILGANVPQSAKYSLCGQTLSMPTAITGQNGAVIKQTTKIGVTGCRKAKKASTKKSKRKKNKKK
jgi:hypothetical protein